ncbi:MAG: two component transcriptional regulator, LytTR family [Bacteroidetes bacterium]|nr:two component transcriptional regulator, LytTR family [Bacteroidota bacterium]
MKVLIVEDESLIAKNLQRMLKEVAPEAEVLAVTDTVKGTVKWLAANPAPDLIFMDIQLGDGVSFDIFSQTSIDRPVIFTTAYNEHAIRAFKYNGIDYLLKPVDKKELKAALDRFHKLYGDNNAKQPEIKELISLLTSKQAIPHKERFLVHHKSGYIPIHKDMISCFYKDQIIYLLASDGQKYVTDYNTLDEIEELVDPVSFFRANRQTLICKSAVESLQKHFTGKIEVKAKGHDATIIDVSREKAQEFRHWLEGDSV